VGWAFNNKSYAWVVANQVPIASVALQISENGVVVTNAFSAGNRYWQIGIAEHIAGWTEPADGGFNTKASAALDYIKGTPEDEVLQASLSYIRTLATTLRAKWQVIAGDTNPETDGFESALEAITALVNRDLLPPPNEL